MSGALVGDIGGTNARFALWENGRLEAVRVLATADFPTPGAAVRSYLESQGLSLHALGAVCLACAGPVGGDEFRFTNNPWRLSRTAFSRELGLKRLLLINDFAAMALGMTRLREGQWREVCPGQAEPGAPRLVIGPGTGLGVATLLPLEGGGWRALPGEGGHVCLPIGTQREAALWQLLHRELGHVEAEAVLSGRGLVRLYRVSCVLDGVPPRFDDPVALTAAALAGDTQAGEVLEQFCCWLGRVAGDNVLTLGARGGVYIVGGVVPRFAERFIASGFSRSFRDKGAMSTYLASLPVRLVTAPYPGLEGAGVALDQAREAPSARAGG